MDSPPIASRGLRGRKYSYCESTTAVHFSDLFRYVEPLCASKDRKTVLALPLSRFDRLRIIAGLYMSNYFFIFLIPYEAFDESIKEPIE